MMEPQENPILPRLRAAFASPWVDRDTAKSLIADMIAEVLNLESKILHARSGLFEAEKRGEESAKIQVDELASERDQIKGRSDAYRDLAVTFITNLTKPTPCCGH